MTIPVTQPGDTFDQWRQNTNTNADNIGDIDNLVTQANNLTDAINESQNIAQVVRDNSIAMAIALGG